MLAPFLLIQKYGFPCSLWAVLGSHGILVKCTVAIFFPSEDTRACSVVTTILSTDSTNPDCFTVPMAVLVEMCYGNNKATTQLPGPSNTLAAGPTVPCPMSLLDSLTVHAKMRYYLFQASSSPIPRM